MKDLVERYRTKFLGFYGTGKEFDDMFYSVLCKARDIGIQNNIKFFARKHHSRILAEKAKFDNEFKNMIEAIDDLSSNMSKFWKELDAHYRYFHKDVVRR